MQNFAEHAFWTRHIFTDESTAFTSEVLKGFMEISGIHIENAIIKKVQVKGMIERLHQKFKQSNEINVDCDLP